MLNPSDFPLINNRNWNLVTLPGARHLNTEDLLIQAQIVSSRLSSFFQEGSEFTSKIVSCEHDLVGAVIKEGDIYTMFLGLGLEVIQALQDAEKSQ